MLNRIFSAVDSLAELGEPLDVRVGLHSGPVVARVIGRQKFSDDLWGGTVNLASRMDGAGRPGRVNDDAAALRAGTPT